MTVRRADHEATAAFACVPARNGAAAGQHRGPARQPFFDFDTGERIVEQAVEFAQFAGIMRAGQRGGQMHRMCGQQP